MCSLCFSRLPCGFSGSSQVLNFSLSFLLLSFITHFGFHIGRWLVKVCFLSSTCLPLCICIWVLFLIHVVYKPNHPSLPYSLQLLCNILQGGNINWKKLISTEITFHTSKVWQSKWVIYCARIKRLPFHIYANVYIFKFVRFLWHQVREHCASRGDFVAVFVWWVWSFPNPNQVGLFFFALNLTRQLKNEPKEPSSCSIKKSTYPWFPEMHISSIYSDSWVDTKQWHFLFCYCRLLFFFNKKEAIGNKTQTYQSKWLPLTVHCWGNVLPLYAHFSLLWQIRAVWRGDRVAEWASVHLRGKTETDHF